MKCQQFACVVCGICKAGGSKHNASKAPHGQAAKHKPSVKDKKYPNFADGLKIFVLGDLDGHRQIDVYSGVNGYHIRSLPAHLRYRNPVIVGAGAGFLVVVDQFADYDLIRVTDEYLGAGEAGYDHDGMPLDSISWAGIADLYQVATPNGTHCAGLTITPSGMLVANLTGRDDCKYLKANLSGHINGGETPAILDGTVAALQPGPLGAGFTLVNQPVPRETDISKYMHQFVTCAYDATQKYPGVYFIDIPTGKVKALHALPSDLDLLGVGFGYGTLSILMGANGEATKIYRLAVGDPKLYMLSTLHNAKNTQGPQEYTVQVFPAYREIVSPTPDQDMTEVSILRYWSTASGLNDVWNQAASKAVPKTLPGRSLRHIPSKSSTALNDARSQHASKAGGDAYGGMAVDITEIAIPAGLHLRSIVSGFGVIAELFNRVDNDQPVFRLVDASTYDFLIDGGFTYGTVDQATGESSPVSNGMQGISIAIDRDYTPGTLKTRDLKAALIDTKTGKWIYWGGKPLIKDDGSAYKVYSGDYASLSAANASRTKASDAQDGLATQIDAITRPERHATDAELWPTNNMDCDRAWALFIRAPQCPSKVTLKPAIASWTNRGDADPETGARAILPEYYLFTIPVSMMASGAGANKQLNNVRYGSPVFNAVGGGGFFVPNWKMTQTTLKEKLTSELHDLSDQRDTLQTSITDEQNPAAKILLQQKLAQVNAQITSISNQLSNTEDASLYEVPASIMGKTVSGIDTSTSQTLDVAAGTYDTETADRVLSLAQLQTTPVGDHPKLVRGVGIETDILTWICIDYRLDYQGMFFDGVSTWVHPETGVNNLGVVVGSYDLRDMHSGYADTFGITGGNVYEAGYRTFLDGDAQGLWKLKVFLDGKDMHKDPDNFKVVYGGLSRAPKELQDYLQQQYTNQGHGIITPGKGDRGTLIIASRKLITNVSILIELWNYAYDVYRYGYRTLTYKGCMGFDPACPCDDPGYWAGDNCEAPGCGNVTCGSVLWGATNKLYAADPSYPVTQQIVWSGTANLTINDDPYDKANILMGRFFDAYIDFDLNAPLGDYDINISKNDPDIGISALV